MSSVGTNVVRLRTDAGLDQQTLAELSEVPQSTLSEIEKDPNKRPRSETLLKLVEGFRKAGRNITVDDLLAEDHQVTTSDSLDWFWRMRFSSMKASERWRYRGTSAAERCAWVVKQLLDAFGSAHVASRLQLDETHLVDLANGQAEITETLIDTLESKADVSPNWLDNGDPPAIDEHLRKILKHKDSGTWLRVIAENMDWAPPELVHGLLQTVRGKKPKQ